VREGFEYRHGHVAGARLLPSSEAWSRVDEVPENKPVAVICGDQTRSAAVASMLLRAGRDARLVMGGMVDWLERGFPVEKQAVAR
jgi:hydroxyacylglutathione hydrolase